MKIGIDIRTFMDANFCGIPEYTYNVLKEIFKLDKKNQYKLFYNSFGDYSHIVPQFDSANVEIIHTAYPNKIFNNIKRIMQICPLINRCSNPFLQTFPSIKFELIYVTN